MRIRNVYKLSSGIVFSALERPWTDISRSRHHCTLSIETVRNTSLQCDLHTAHSKGVTWNDREWSWVNSSEIFNDTKQRAVSLRQLSFSFHWFSFSFTRKTLTTSCNGSHCTTTSTGNSALSSLLYWSAAMRPWWDCQSASFPTGPTCWR